MNNYTITVLQNGQECNLYTTASAYSLDLHDESTMRILFFIAGEVVNELYVSRRDTFMVSWAKWTEKSMPVPPRGQY